MSNVIFTAMDFQKEVDYQNVLENKRRRKVVRFNGDTMDRLFEILNKGYEIYFDKSVVVDIDAIYMKVSELSRKTNVTKSFYFQKMYFSPDCPIVTPYHRIISERRKKILDLPYWDTSAEVRVLSESLTIYDLFFGSAEQIRRKLLHFYAKYKDFIRNNKILGNEVDVLFSEEALNNHALDYKEKAEMFFKNYPFFAENIVELKDTDYGEYTFVGQQGVLLDAKYGIFRSNENTTILQGILAMKQVSDSFIAAKKVGVASTIYTTSKKLPTTFRFSEDGKNFESFFDAVLFRYAQRVNKVQSVYLTNIERMIGIPKLKVCTSYTFEGLLDDTFSQCFNYYYDADGHVIITDIKKHCRFVNVYLNDCKPNYISVPGLEANKGDFDLFIGNLMNYIKVVKSQIHLPIECISFGETKEHVMFIH